MGNTSMDYSMDELMEAKRQIDSTLHKLRATIKTFEAKENASRYKSQITEKFQLEIMISKTLLTAYMPVPPDYFVVFTSVYFMTLIFFCLASEIVFSLLPLEFPLPDVRISSISFLSGSSYRILLKGVEGKPAQIGTATITFSYSDKSNVTSLISVFL